MVEQRKDTDNDELVLLFRTTPVVENYTREIVRKSELPIDAKRIDSPIPNMKAYKC